MSGRRENNKVERRERIRCATLDILAEKGFEAATTREIARRAGVAAGTIFLYAENKVDLFLMSLNDELDRLNDAAFAGLEGDQPLIEQIIVFLRPRYEFWSRHPDLYRASTGDRAAYSVVETSQALAPGIGRRAHAQQRLGEILRRGSANEEVRPELDIDGLARIILDVYLTELRFWLSADSRDIEDGLQKLRYLLNMIVASIVEGRSA
ncbi:TetR/AcrR family transcriptional regulator [Caulobacter sp. S45]|uniref:TetR/AcrR family transcriptional regulator n=1 Tax=Caulobacter sp. S45 TaxID=1641861 RepID=UPI00131C317C|nr:TetR/AcrR family transcriptional regulator [Caulobacter sp. S45]